MSTPKSKTPLEKLTSGEREILAHFYGSESYEVLRKLIDLERLDLAKDHVNQVDILNVRFLSGQSTALKQLVLTLKQNKKDTKKSEG